MNSRLKMALVLLTSLILTLAACTSREPQIPVTGPTTTAESPVETPGLPPKVILDAQQ